MAADLNVFDPDTVGPAVPRLVDDLPGRGPPARAAVAGFLATVVDGQVTIRDGEPTGAGRPAGSVPAAGRPEAGAATQARRVRRAPRQRIQTGATTAADHPPALLRTTSSR